MNQPIGFNDCQANAALVFVQSVTEFNIAGSCLPIEARREMIGRDAVN
ncbi:MAG TPA: hypothetical protein VH592_09940 [Gemmataceae bacterium]|jgi:hypothetical protein